MLRSLHDLDFAHLRHDVAASKAAVDHAEPTFLSLNNRHCRTGDRVHVGGNDGMLERNVLGESRRQIDRLRIATLEHAEVGRKQKVVEGTAAYGREQIAHAVIIARLISCTRLRTRMTLRAAGVLALLLLAVGISGQAPNPTGPYTVLSRDGRRPLPTVEMQGHPMVGLDDLANVFQLQIREDPAARAVTATYKNQTLVLTPDQSLVSASGRLLSLPAPLTRQGRRWLVPVE